MENWETITRKWRQNAKKTLFPNFVTVGNSGSLIGKQVYLELFVKTIKNWRDKERYLQEFVDKEEI